MGNHLGTAFEVDRERATVSLDGEFVIKYAMPSRQTIWQRMDRARNPQKYRDKHNQWRKENPEKAKAAADRHNRTKTTKYSLLKHLANKRELELTITKEEYISIVTDATCSYCNEPLSPTGMGLDRVDSSKGYVQGNVVPCCGPCNTKKGCMEMAGFKYPRTVELLEELNAAASLRRTE